MKQIRSLGEQLPSEPPQDNVVSISWSVRWGSIGSITSWSGYCRTRVPGVNYTCAQV
jgi:hypothetical protein